MFGLRLTVRNGGGVDWGWNQRGVREGVGEEEDETVARM